jgi:hypothetical protein
MSSSPINIGIGVPEASISVSDVAEESALSTSWAISRQTLFRKELVAKPEPIRCDLELSDQRIVRTAARL